MARKITPGEYNEWLEQDGRGIVALEPYIGSATKILHQCLKGHQWRAVPKSIKEGSDCPYCSGCIAQDYDAWLEQDGRGYVALEPYISSSANILHQCAEGHQWEASPNHIKRGRNCPYCSGKRAPDYSEWLKQDGRGITALEPYVSALTRIKHQCLEGHKWSTVPSSIKQGYGCPTCSDTGTDANVFYIWENADDAGVYKVGLTSERCADKRILECSRGNKMKANIILMLAVRDARDIESKALEMGESVDYPTSIDGHTEFRRYTDHELGKVYQLAVRSA
jgi:hypothetical protein